VKRKFTDSIGVVLMVLALVFAVGGCGYVNYKVYHAKYPNTGFWTWFFDRHK
jgi:hypothetical protein